MKVADAKRIAGEWLMEYTRELPRFVGAIFAGSIHEKQDDQDWPVGSDVDLFIYQSGKTSERLPKFEHHGLTIEAALHSADDLEQIEKVLSHPHIAPHFANCQILIDPNGKMAQLHHEVKKEFANPKYISARMDWVYNNAVRKFQQTIDAKGEILIGPLCVFLLGLRNMAALVPVATLSNPTLRRCLMVARDGLIIHCAGELHQQMIKLLGSEALSREQVQAMVPPMTQLYRLAASLARTPFWARFELSPDSENMFVNGAQEMISAGDHQEAVFFILFVHYFCHHAISLDGSDLQKQQNIQLLNQTLAIVGIHRLADLQERAALGMQLLPQVRAVCDQILI